MRVFKRLWNLTSDDLVVLILAFFGVMFGLRTLNDNSTLLHIRTGQQIFDSLSVPSTDPYSFSAFGVDWVVQSWLAEGIYGALHALGSWHYVLFFNMALAIAIAVVTGVLAKTGRGGRTALAGLTAMLVGVFLWAPRPFLFAFLAFGLTLLVVQKQKSPLWLLPIGWVWVNTHGSFPIGVAWLVLAMLGQRLDPERIKIGRYLLAFLVSIGLGALNPVGPQLLTFWSKALGNSEAFSGIVEWSSPDFHSPSGVLLLFGIVMSVLILARGKTPWRLLLPVLVLMAATLWSVRNGAFLSIALAPALASALQDTRAHGEERLRSRAFSRVAALVIVLSAVLLIVPSARSSAFNFDTYPIAALDSLAAEEAERVLAPEWVGNYRIFRDGEDAKVFFDDRYDMYPEQVVSDYTILRKATGGTPEVLDRYDFTAIVWQTDTTFVDYLKASSDWTVKSSDEDWTLFVARSAGGFQTLEGRIYGSSATPVPAGPEQPLSIRDVDPG